MHLIKNLFSIIFYLLNAIYSDVSHGCIRIFNRDYWGIRWVLWKTWYKDVRFKYIKEKDTKFYLLNHNFFFFSSIWVSILFTTSTGSSPSAIFPPSHPLLFQLEVLLTEGIQS